MHADELDSMAFVTIWWFISAHKWFKGPVINVEHAMLGREEAILNGVSSDSDAGKSVMEDKKLEAEVAPPAPTEIK